MKVAITTAGGQLGRAIIQEAILKIGKEHIVAIARTPEKVQHLGVEVRKGDYNNYEEFVSAFKDVDVALIISGMDKPDKRIEQHRNVINGAKVAGAKKIVYTSIYGELGKCTFDAIIKSNRQTEEDVTTSGLDWIIGRNGLYSDADFEAIDDYRKAGKIANCADNGKCAYTSRQELAVAYVNLMTDERLNNKIYNLCGEAITQQQLTDVLNDVFGEKLIYESMSVEAYVEDRKNEHGEFLGMIIGGIYQGIREGVFDVPSDFKLASGREHLTIREMAEQYK